MPDSNNIAKGIGSALLNLATKGQAFIGEGYEQLANWQEWAKRHRDVTYPDNSLREGTFHNWDEASTKWMRERGHNIQKDMTEYQLNNEADKFTGYDSKNVEEWKKTVNNTFEKDGFLSAAKSAFSDPAIIEAVLTSTPDALATGLSLGGMALVNANNNINMGEAKLGRKMTSKEKANSATYSALSTLADKNRGIPLIGNSIGTAVAKGLVTEGMGEQTQTIAQNLAQTPTKNMSSFGSLKNNKKGYK